MKQSTRRNCIMYLCYWIYFVGSGIPRSSKRGMDQLNRLQSISARWSCPSAQVSIYKYSGAVDERHRSGTSLAIDWYNVQYFQRHATGYLNVMFSTKGLIVGAGRKPRKQIMLCIVCLNNKHSSLFL